MLATRNTITSFSIDLTTVEAWAALDVIIFIKEIWMYDIILEGDAK
jgi:hypothetical protein